VRHGRAWLLGGQEGYAVTGDGVLLEFFAGSPALEERLAAFDAVIAASGVRSLLAKSFDHHVLAMARHRAGPLETVGALFRIRLPVARPAAPPLRARPARPDDLPGVLGLDPAFFDDAEEPAFYASSREAELVLFHGEDGTLAGCGLSRTVVEGRPDVDIGMAVAPVWRRRGVGAAIVEAMKNRVEARGGRAICGCDIDNLASRRCLERAGFIARHSLLEGTLERA